MKKNIFLVVIFVLIILSSFLIYFLNDPYFKVRNADTEDGVRYLSVYKRLLKSSEFDSLMKRLIIENMDLKSIGTAVIFSVEDSLCYYIPLIKKKCDYFKSFPADTTWKVQISTKFSRSYNGQQDILDYYMCVRLQELQKKCR